MAPYVPPTYPVILTQKDWDKKKGVIAKAYGKTGIGAECAKLEAAYRAVDWSKLDIATRFDKEMGLAWQKPDYTPAKLKGIRDDAAAEASGRLNTLAKALKDFHAFCTPVVAKFKKSNIPASSAKHVESMQKAAADFAKLVSPQVAGQRLTREAAAAREKVDVILDTNVLALKSVAGKQAQLVATIRNANSVVAYNKGVEVVRDLTQPMSNYALMVSRGWRPPTAQAATLAQDLAVFSSAQHVQLPGGASGQDLAAAIDKLATTHGKVLTFAASAK